MVLEDRALNETIFPQYGENNGLLSVEYTPDWEIGFFKMVSSRTVFFYQMFIDINDWLFGMSSWKELLAATIWKFHFH